MHNPDAPRVANAHENGQTASVGSGPLLGVRGEYQEARESLAEIRRHLSNFAAQMISPRENIFTEMQRGCAKIQAALTRAEDAHQATLCRPDHPAVAALRESSSLLAFLHGAFASQLKPRDVDRLERAHAANRAALCSPNTKVSHDGA